MSHNETKLVTEILSKIAKEKSKTFERIKRLLLIEENSAINRRFWEILDTQLPNHTFTYVGCCADCGSLELC